MAREEEWPVLARETGVVVEISTEEKLRFGHVDLGVQDVLVPHQIHQLGGGNMMLLFGSSDLVKAQEATVLLNRLLRNAGVWKVFVVVPLQLADESCEIELLWIEQVLARRGGAHMPQTQRKEECAKGLRHLSVATQCNHYQDVIPELRPFYMLLVREHRPQAPQSFRAPRPSATQQRHGRGEGPALCLPKELVGPS